MKRFVVTCVCAGILIGLLSCAAPVPTPTQVPAAATPASIVLEVVGPAGARSFTMADLQALPATEGWAGTKNSAGRVFPPQVHKGVLLEELCRLVGGVGSDKAVQIVAKDGYAMTMSYDQAIAGKLITYDPGTGDEYQIGEPLQVVLAYEREGQPLPEDSDGILRLVAITSKNNQVTDGHWSVKWVQRIVVKEASQEWTLSLEGARSDSVDRASFESCSTASCHGKTWKDDQGVTWSGTPLWYLVGRVDDDIAHQARAYNDSLADKGYTVDVVAADGYAATLDSGRIKFNNDLIVAEKTNGEPLENKYFPLRLVGAAVQRKEFVGQIAKIVLHLDAEPAATQAPPTVQPTSAPTAHVQPAPTGGALAVYGKVDKAVALSLDDLKAMQVEIKAEHPKKGLLTYQGPRLNDVLKKAGVRADATKLVLVASDGYQAEVALADLATCADCLVAIEDTALSSVMPGMQSSTWVKGLVKIELQ